MYAADSRTCCFTGHRPNKLLRSSDAVRLELEREILLALQDGYTRFITGMAMGVDIWAAEYLLRLRELGTSLSLICALPCPDFEARWNADWQRRYRLVLEGADRCVTVCPTYSPSCFQLRNRWMVDRSDRLIAVYSGEAGGTRNTIAYAMAKEVPIRFIKG